MKKSKKEKRNEKKKERMMRGQRKEEQKLVGQGKRVRSSYKGSSGGGCIDRAALRGFIPSRAIRQRFSPPANTLLLL